MGIRININFDEKRWLKTNFRARARKAFEAALSLQSCVDFLEKTEVSILACNDQVIRRLNNQFRGVNTTTDVLSWPRTDQLFFYRNKVSLGQKSKNDTFDLGDIAISYDTCTKQSADLELKFEDHVVHLLIHACLHLLGFNHQKDTDFQKMKELEIKCLEACGIEDPYAL